MNFAKRLPTVPETKDKNLQTYFSGIKSVFDSTMIDLNKFVKQLVNGTDVPKLLNPTGAISMYGAATAPDGWLLCDGSSYLRTDYADLFAIIGTNFGTADSTHFNVPDMKDAFPRGTGTSTIFTNNTKGSRTASKTGGASSGIGSKQDDSMQGHHHTHSIAYGAGSSQYALNVVGGDSGEHDDYGSWKTKSPKTDGSSGTPRVDAETRAKNIELNFIIKY